MRTVRPDTPTISFNQPTTPWLIEPEPANDVHRKRACFSSRVPTWVFAQQFNELLFRLIVAKFYARQRLVLVVGKYEFISASRK